MRETERPNVIVNSVLGAKLHSRRDQARVQYTDGQSGDHADVNAGEICEHTCSYMGEL